MAHDSPHQEHLAIPPTSDAVQVGNLGGRLVRRGFFVTMAIVVYGIVAGGVAFVIGGIIIGFVGLALMSVAMKKNFDRYWYEPELLTPRLDVRLGETFAVTYRQRVKLPQILAGTTVTADLVCEEWVRYKAGSSTHTKKSVRRTIPLSPAMAADDLAVVAGLTIAIPTDLPPSFSLSNNRLSWYVAAKVESPRAPDAKYQFELMVRPEFWKPHAFEPTDPDDPDGFRPPEPGTWGGIDG